MSISKSSQIYLFCVLEEFGLNDIAAEWESVSCIFYAPPEVLEFRMLVVFERRNSFFDFE